MPEIASCLSKKVAVSKYHMGASRKKRNVSWHHEESQRHDV